MTDTVKRYKDLLTRKGATEDKIGRLQELVTLLDGTADLEIDDDVLTVADKVWEGTYVREKLLQMIGTANQLRDAIVEALDELAADLDEFEDELTEIEEDDANAPALEKAGLL